MKEDAPPPERPPAKRRQLERVPDLWLAVWASDEWLPPSARRRAQDERDRRKAAVPDVVVGVIVGVEGVTPAQLATLVIAVHDAGPTAIFHTPSTSRKLIRTFPDGVPVDQAGPKEIVRAASTVFVAPKGSSGDANGDEIWEAARYARHRKIPVRVVRPDGRDD